MNEGGQERKQGAIWGQLQVSRKEMCHCHLVSSGHRRSEDNLRSWNGQDTDGLDIKVRKWEVSG